MTPATNNLMSGAWFVFTIRGAASLCAGRLVNQEMDCDSYALVLVFESCMRKTRAKSAKIPDEIADWLTAGVNSRHSMQEHCPAADAIVRPLWFMVSCQ
jgi:hypothetical protein